MAKGKQLRRRSHLALKKKVLLACSHCKKMIVPHTVCKYCGYYKGRLVVDIVGKKLSKQEKRKKAQQ